MTVVMDLIKVVDCGADFALVCVEVLQWHAYYTSNSMCMYVVRIQFFFFFLVQPACTSVCTCSKCLCVCSM